MALAPIDDSGFGNLRINESRSVTCGGACNIFKLQAQWKLL
jgi:hypothetical protein